MDRYYSIPEERGGIVDKEDVLCQFVFCSLRRLSLLPLLAEWLDAYMIRTFQALSIT